jgi:hypothetical protein
MATADIAAVPVTDFEHRRQLRRAVIASTVGTTIEWYDFLLYGQMAALVFANLYFPSSAPLTGTLQAFAVFAVGFVARPRWPGWDRWFPLSSIQPFFSPMA